MKVKILISLVSLIALSSCGIKTLIIPHIDWLMTRKISEELQLNTQQKNELKNDIKFLLENRKSQASRIKKYIESLDSNNIDVIKIMKDLNHEYKELLKEFLPIYSKYLCKLSEKQIFDFEEQFKYKNKEIQEEIDINNAKKIIDRFEKNIGSLTILQIKLIEENKDNFIKSRKYRLQTRTEYQTKLLQVLRSQLANDIKYEKVYQLSWEYNTNINNKNYHKLNFKTVNNVLASMTTKQKNHLKEKLKDYVEWIEMYLKENYLT